MVELASQGLSNPGIAGELFISRNTVKAYLSRAYAKLGVANRTELARDISGRLALYRERQPFHELPKTDPR